MSKQLKKLGHLGIIVDVCQESMINEKGIGVRGTMLDLRQAKEDELMESITMKREKMIKVAALRGMRNNETVKQSKELDALIMVYQKRFIQH